MRRALAAASLFVVYVAAAKAGLSLASINPSATAVWPPTGIAIAACLLMGRAAWPVIFAGAFLANVTNAGSPATSLAIAAGNTLEGVIGAYCIERFASGRDAFARAPDVFRFTAIAALCTAVSATVGVTTLSVAGYAAWSSYRSVWSTWWLGDVAGALVFAPLIIAWTSTATIGLPRGRWLEAVFLAAALLAADAVVFAGAYPAIRHYPLAFVCIPPVVWAAFRFGPRETATSIAQLSVVATWSTHRQDGPFFAAGVDSLIVLQAFMVTMAITALAMAALVEERRRIGRERLRLLAAERDARAEAEAANLAKDEFLAMLGHELRNPIGAIAAAIHVLGRSTASDAVAGRARDVIVRQTEHLTRLVDDLLDVTRVTTGKITLSRARVDLGAAATRAIDALAAAGKTRDHAITADVRPAWVEGDATRLEQVVTNLVGNAVKYTPAGGAIHVVVAAERDGVTLRVADTGIGIAPDLLPRVFDLFAQGERGLDRTGGGLGIGLTLVKRLVELHGGSIEVRSDGAGRGSEFIVRMPAASVPALDRSPSPEAAATGRGRAARRVLIVEDQPDMREIMRMALESAGHQVSAAADGPAAVEAVRRLRPDVALVDIGLPGFDGYEVARRIRSVTGELPIFLVALTGYGQPDDRRRAEAAGFDLYLVKPVDVERLEALLAEWTPASPSPNR